MRYLQCYVYLFLFWNFRGNYSISRLQGFQNIINYFNIILFSQQDCRSAIAMDMHVHNMYIHIHVIYNLCSLSLNLNYWLRYAYLVTQIF